MTTTPRPIPASRRDDASRQAQRAEKSSVRLPVARRVPVPPPDQLALYGALGVLGVAIAINWPMALVIGAGTAVLVQRVNARPSTRSGPGTPYVTETQAAPALAA
jgi:hypothetical protein